VTKYPPGAVRNPKRFPLAGAEDYVNKFHSFAIPPRSKTERQQKPQRAIYFYTPLKIGKQRKNQIRTDN
jgi:hypothetical protein